MQSDLPFNLPEALNEQVCTRLDYRMIDHLGFLSIGSI